MQAMASLPAGRRAGLPRPDPARRGADRALGHPAAAAPAPGRALRGTRAAARPDRGDVAIEAPRTHGTNLAASEFSAQRPALVPDPARGGRRDLHGGPRGCSACWLRPGLLGRARQQLQPAAGLHRDRADGGRHELSSWPTATSTCRSGAVLALSGSTAAFLMKFMGWTRCLAAGSAVSRPALLAGCVNGTARTGRSACPPSSPRWACSTSPAASPPGWSPGRQLSQLPGELQPHRPQADRVPRAFGHWSPRAGCWSTSPRRSRPRASCSASWRSWPASCSAKTP